MGVKHESIRPPDVADCHCSTNTGETAALRNEGAVRLQADEALMNSSEMQPCNMRGHLDSSFSARLEHSANGMEISWQVFMAHSLYHLTADHLVKAAG